MSISVEKLKGKNDLHTFLLNLSACLLQNQLRIWGMRVGTHTVNRTVALITAAVLNEVSCWEDQCILWHWACSHIIFIGKEYRVNTSFLNPIRKDTRSSLLLCSKDTVHIQGLPPRLWQFFDTIQAVYHRRSCCFTILMTWLGTNSYPIETCTPHPGVGGQGVNPSDSYKLITSDPNAPFMNSFCGNNLGI